MEKICDTRTNQLFEHDFIVVLLIEYLDIKSIVKLKQLNSAIREAIEAENYALFQKLREYLHIPPSFNKSDALTSESVSEMFKRVLETLKQKPSAGAAFAYYTDGGVDTNSNYYFLQNVWKKTGIGYGTISHENVFVQSILSKPVELPLSKNNPMDFLVKPKNKLKIRIPYEDYVTNEEDNFQILKTFQIHLRSGGYTAYVKSFAVFYSETEVQANKFSVMTKNFMKVEKSGDVYSKLKLKVLNKQEFKKGGVKIYEFDVSEPKYIERGYKLKNPHVYPLLYVEIQQKYVNQTIDYEIKQNVAAKFLGIKLLKSSNSSASSNIDLYNLGLKTIPLKLDVSKTDSVVPL